MRSLGKRPTGECERQLNRDRETRVHVELVCWGGPSSCPNTVLHFHNAYPKLLEQLVFNGWRVQPVLLSRFAKHSTGLFPVCKSPAAYIPFFHISEGPYVCTCLCSRLVVLINNTTFKEQAYTHRSCKPTASLAKNLRKSPERAREFHMLSRLKSSKLNDCRQEFAVQIHRR